MMRTSFQRIFASSVASSSLKNRRPVRKISGDIAWVEVLDSRVMLSAAATFQFQAIASNLDTSKHLFNQPGNSTSPYTLLRGGTGTMTSINGFPHSYNLAGGIPSSFTFKFGAASPSDPSALKLTAFDNGLTDGIGKQFFTKSTGNVNTLTVLLSGKAVATGTLESLTALTNHSFVTTGVGVFKITAAVGTDATVFNEFMRVSGGTGLLSFHLGTFTFSGAPTGYGSDASLFSSTGSLDAQAVVNKAPIGTAKTVTTLEDVPYVIKPTDFGFSDPNNSPSNSFAAVKITTVPTAGKLTDNGVTVLAGSQMTFSDINTGKLKFVPVANANGSSYSSFTFQVQDDGGTLIGGVDTDVTARKMSVSVTPVNDAPVGTNKLVTTLEETAYAFKTADFGFTDPGDIPANILLAVKITTLPLKGTLTDNGIAVAAGAHVTAVDIATGKLKYTPGANGFGSEYASFTFQVQDNGGTANGGKDTDLTPRHMTIAVTAVNDAPVGAAKTVTMLEDSSYLLKVGDFGFTDPNDVPANTMLSVKITTLPILGKLTDNGVAVTAGAHIPVADLVGSKLKYAPAVNGNGAAYASFTFQVQDTGGTANGGHDTDTTARKLTLSVTSVNDAPTGTAKTVSTLKNTAYVFKVTDFGFSDVKDTPPNTFLNVKISTLPAVGTLTDNGVAVTAGARISVADITAGKLKYTPPMNGTGAALGSFLFQVQDNCGTANGGIDLDPTARKMTISVT